ncbi:MAG TPA: LptA/OstA family protein [Verrucomicrobiae bacterium]|jgi:lipopolysaccharide transport protein LptA
MKFFRAAAICWMLWVALPLLGQAPTEAVANHFRIAHYTDTPKGRVLEMLVSAQHGESGKNGDVATQFEMTEFRNGRTNLIAVGPECHISPASAWDAGHIEMFTPSTNVFVQGDGFFFNETNHFLFLSNNVETRVARELLKSPLLSSPRTNEPVAAQPIIITSQRCQFDASSNRAEYFGNVRIKDPQMDITSDYLFVQLTTNGGIDNIFARQNVVITTTNKGRATGSSARYYTADGSEMMVLTGDSTWLNGGQQARAEQFTYDSTRHILWASNHVRVRWPGGLQTNPEPAETFGARLLFADDAMLQMPLTNGPVESMTADGNVIIVNQADQSRSTGDHAVYSREENRFELTGSPVWWNDRVTIHAQSLVAEVTNQVYHARGNAKFETVPGTNQWLAISSTNIDFQTNLAVFRDDVAVRLSANGALRDSLNCNSLNVELLSNEVTTAVARGHVRGETTPDRLGNVKTISCESLTAHRSPTTLLITDLQATDRVVMTETGVTTNAPRNKLTSDSVVAKFFAHTNQIETAVAEGNVVLDQIKPTQSIHATSARADYTAANDQVKLTGDPKATTDKFLISDADYLIWQPKTNRFGASGLYKIVPVPVKRPHPPS